MTSATSLVPIACSYMGNRTSPPTIAAGSASGARRRTTTCDRARVAARCRPDAAMRAPRPAKPATGAARGLVCPRVGELPRSPGPTGWISPGWARTDLSATAEILACWQDDVQHVLRVDWSGPVEAGVAADHRVAGRPRRWARHRPPGGRGRRRSTSLRLRSGAQTPRSTDHQVFVNQVGYDLAGPKPGHRQQFLPHREHDDPMPAGGTEGHPTVWSRDVPCAGQIHGSRPDGWADSFWQVDFPTCMKPVRSASLSPPATCRPSRSAGGRAGCSWAAPRNRRGFLLRPAAAGSQCPAGTRRSSSGRCGDRPMARISTRPAGGCSGRLPQQAPMWMFGDGAAAPLPVARAHRRPTRGAFRRARSRR